MPHLAGDRGGPHAGYPSTSARQAKQGWSLDRVNTVRGMRRVAGSPCAVALDHDPHRTADGRTWGRGLSPGRAPAPRYLGLTTTTQRPAPRGGRAGLSHASNGGTATRSRADATIIGLSLVSVHKKTLSRLSHRDRARPDAPVFGGS